MSVDLAPEVVPTEDQLETTESTQDATPQPSEGTPESLEVDARIVLLSSSLACAAAAWMVAGIFGDFSAHLVTLVGVALGAGVTALAVRLRSALVQYSVLPLAALVGAIMVAPSASTSNSSLPAQIGDALTSGGFLQPPVPFDPGWRFLLVVLFALVTSGSAYLAFALRRVKLGVALPMPLVIGAAVIQPSSSEIPTVAVAMLLAVISMAIAYGAELGAHGQLGAAFESRRLLRGLALGVALAVGVVGISRVGFLFPQPNRSHVIPPQRPPQPPEVLDQVLFTYSGQQVPLRLGVIDTYETSAGAWFLPPFDPSTFVHLNPPATVPDTGLKEHLPTVTVSITVANLSGHGLPSVAGLSAVSGPGAAVDYDPRTQAIRLDSEPVYTGYHYTLTGIAPPTGAQLGAAPAPPSSLSPYLVAPPRPSEVTTLLDAYAALTQRQGTHPDAFSRMQYLRTALYSHVVAAGVGVPVDVSANRVGEMLDGSNASPYEITAAEALLARWAGVPSRIGFGYYGGQPGPGHTFQVHPDQGATWLEVYFGGYGWVPIVGVPPQAVPSFSTKAKNPLNIQASNQLALIVYIPEENQSLIGLYEYVRYYLERILPVGAGLLLMLAAYPVLLKRIRRRRRKRWAQTRGPAGRIAVAYCNLRDAARDLAIGNPAATPIEFIEAIAADPENAELAWLVSRALWGDLRRDLRTEDAEAAERLAASVQRRLVRAQPALSILLGMVARTSIRDPFSRNVPNVPLPTLHLDRLRQRIDAWRRDLRRRRHGRRLAPVAAAVISILLLSSCGSSASRAALPPQNLVPARLGSIAFTRAAKAEKQFANLDAQALITGGYVYTVRYAGVTEGDVQVELFKPSVTTSDLEDDRDVYCAQNLDSCPGAEVFRGMEQTLGNGQFQRIYVGSERVYVMALDTERIYMWFPPNTNAMVVLVLIASFTQSSSDAVMQALLAYERGTTPQAVPVPSPQAADASPSPTSTATPTVTASP